MLVNINNTTKLAIQAATAVLLTILICEYFHLERSYWATLTSLLLISQTWGESIKKAFERVSMTILGGITGTVLYFFLSDQLLLPDQQLLIFFIITVSVFFALFFLTIEYLISVFFITLIIVFLFALLSQWNFHILNVRIYETLIGAVIAITTSAVVLPIRAHHSLPDLFQKFLIKVQHITDLSFQVVLGSADSHLIEQQRDTLIKTFQQLSKHIDISHYEFLFSRYNRHQSDEILTAFHRLLHYTTSMLETSAELYAQQLDCLRDPNQELPGSILVNHNANEICKKSDNMRAQSIPGDCYNIEFFEQIQSLKFKFATNLQVICNAFHFNNKALILIKLENDIEHNINYVIRTSIQGNVNLDILSFFYYIRKANEVLEEIAHTLE